MAEDEIRKHAKSAFNIMKDKESDLKHKLKDITLEILIIVFAVTISIWFHNWSDKLQEQKEEKAFLTGLKIDLAGDIVNIQNSLGFYKNAYTGLRYFTRVGAGDTLNKDSLKKYSNIIISSTNLEPHTSRYEGLKSSGKLGIIEEPELLNNIIELNESTFTHIQLLNDFYLKFVYKASDFMQQHVQLNPRGEYINAPSLLRNSQWRLLIDYGQASIIENIIPAQEDGLKKCRELIQEIDKENK